MRYRQATSTAAHKRRLLACWILSIALNGCQPAELDWQVRQTPFHSSTLDPLTPPAIDLLRVEPANRNIDNIDNIDNLDFLSLRGCDLQRTVVRRNTRMARSARPAQRLLLALEFVHRAPACVVKLHAEGKHSLSYTIAQATRRQKARLPSLIYNATLGAQEYRSLWLTTAPASDYPPVDTAVTAAALESLNQQVGHWLEGNYQVDNRAFEIMLSEVAGGKAGVLLGQLIEISECLHTLSPSSCRGVKTGALCVADFRAAMASTLRAVISRYVTGTRQPDSTLLATRYRALAAPITTLEALLDRVLPSAYRQWQNRRDLTFELAKASLQQHGHRPDTMTQPCMPKDNKIRYTDRLTQ